MIRVAGSGLPDGADLTGLNSHRRARAVSQACGLSSAYVGISFMIDVMISADG
jgi:hypothetical protein